MNNYIREKQGIFQSHFILLKNFYQRKQLSDIKHVNLYKEWKHFIEAIIYQKKISIRNYSYTVQTFFNISNEEVSELKNIDLEFINKIIDQETYTKSIQLIQNYPDKIKLIEQSIISIFSKVFRRLLL